MDGNLYYLTEDNQVAAVGKKEYDKEQNLEDLIAQNPGMLLRSSDEGLELKLIQKQLPMNGCVLDVMLVDSGGVPVLVEVKLSRNYQIYRSVVGQLLDYGARASALDVSSLRTSFEKNNEGADPTLYGDGFWNQVGENLRNGKMRLVIVADSFPIILKNIINFLDRNLSNIELYGVEVPQYRDPKINVTMVGTSFVRNVSEEVRKTGQLLSFSQDQEGFEANLEDKGLLNCIPAFRQFLAVTEGLGLTVDYTAGTTTMVAHFRLNGTEIASAKTYNYSGKYMRCPLDFEVHKKLAKILAVDEEGQRKAEERIHSALSGVPGPEGSKINWGSAEHHYLDIGVFNAQEACEAFRTGFGPVVEDLRRALTR